MSQRPPVDQSPAHWCVLYYANVPPPSVPPWIIHPLVRGELAWGTLTRRHFLSQDANNHSLYFLFLPGMQDSFAAYNKSLLLKWPKRWYQDWSWVIVTSSLPLSLEVSSTMPLALSLPLLPIQCGALAPSAPSCFSQGRAGESSACLSRFSAKELWAEWYKMNGFPDSAKIYAKHVFYEMTHCKGELCYCSWRDFSEEKSHNFASEWL